MSVSTFIVEPGYIKPYCNAEMLGSRMFNGFTQTQGNASECQPKPWWNEGTVALWLVPVNNPPLRNLDGMVSPSTRDGEKSTATSKMQGRHAIGLS